MVKDPPVSVTLRLPKSIRDLLKVAADRDRRSMANMAEVMIVRYCESNGISVGSGQVPKRKSTTKTRD